jgi:diguanylate cyclase (GGDEF)-like protein
MALELIPGLLTSSKSKLLIVDDQVINVQVLHSAFSADFQVFMATSGAKALEACAKQLPDLVLLDVMMPEMDGYEVCRRLKADPLTADIPVIFVTAHNDDDSEARGLDVGAVDFISKPINLKIVRARVRTHITLKKQSDLLRNMAFVDGLTGAHNRRYFDEQLAIEAARGLRNKQTLSLILMDVDFFKRFNDRYGHQAGDDCLKQLARAFQSCLKRPADLVARYGGEEFVCLLPDTNAEGAMIVAEALRLAVMACAIPHAQSTAHAHVTVSLGIATLRVDQPVSVAELLKQADQNLYLAKDQGRNRALGLATNGVIAPLRL